MAETPRPQVSIITPSYNSARYLGQTISSVQAQTFTDWEMIVVDDHSRDGSHDLARARAGEDPRIRPLRLDGGATGAAAARNRAIAEARGRYIAFLDSDDLWTPDKLERQLAFMAEHGAALSYARYQPVDRDGAPFGAALEVPATLDHRTLLKTCPIGCLTAIYDTDLVGKQFMPDLPKGQDYALWLQILRRHPLAHGMDAVLGFYRTGGPSLSSNKVAKFRSIWRLYRQVEGLSLPRSVTLMTVFCANFVVKALRRGHQ